MKKRKIFCLATMFFVFSQVIFPQGETFLRRNLLYPNEIEPGGWGNFVTNLDVDNDGRPDLFAVNGNIDLLGSPNTRIPRLYKYEWNGNSWELVWSTELSSLRQGIYPAITSGDWDSDGKKEIIWGPTNNFDDGNIPNPSRVIVFESKGDGSDVMGISIPGTNNYRPNAKWTITQTPYHDIQPFRWKLADADNDSKQELVFIETLTSMRFGVISVNNIPDNGDGSETWTLEYSGTGMGPIFPAELYDFALLGTKIYLICKEGTIIPVFWNGINYVAGTPQKLLPIGSWRSASTVDIDNDGEREIVLAGNGTGSTKAKVWLLRSSGDTLTSTEIANLSSLSVVAPPAGGDAGDVDGDGKYDFIFGTQHSLGHILRLKYIGGNIASPLSYQKQRIDRGLMTFTLTYDLIGLTNIDSEPGMEILYSVSYRDTHPADSIPIATLKDYTTESIAAIKTDNNNNLQPDRLNETVRIKGGINGINLASSDNIFRYTIQDSTGGVTLIKESEPGGGPLFRLGEEVIAKGKITQERGNVQLELSSTKDVVKTDTIRDINAIKLTIPNYIQNAYKYQSRFIEIASLYKDPSVTVPWPPLNSDADFGIWDLVNKLTLRIDKETDIDGQPEPSWPTRIRGVATQYTSAPNIYNDGYQISPMQYSDATLYGTSSLTVISPNGGENWTSNLYRYIRWSRNFVTNVKIDINFGTGSTWRNIVPSTPAATGQYKWIVENIPIVTNCRVRISDAADTSVYDISDGPFTISSMNSALMVTSPDGGEIIRAGSNFRIEWLQNGVNSIKIEFTSDNGAVWSTIAESISANLAGYQWTLPNITSTQCRIRISNPTNPAINDLSDSLFTIVPFSLTLIFPNGGESWLAGTQKNITWSSDRVNNIKIDYRTFEGGSFLNIVPSVPANGGIFTWFVPNTPSAQCRLRISSTEDSTFYSESSLVFTILPVASNGLGWVILPNQQYSMSIIAKVEKEHGPPALYSTNPNDILGAFVVAGADTQCRGISGPLSSGIYSLIIGSNLSAGETVIFRYYDQTNNLIKQLPEVHTFQSMLVIGTPSTPRIFNAGMVPVELSSFTGSVNKSRIILNWTTATEKNNRGFEIERKNKEDQFIKAGFVEGHGTTTEGKSYIYSEDQPVSGVYVYRLKQIDYGGKSSYSNAIEILLESPKAFSLSQNYPNPFNPSTVISYQLPVSSHVYLKLFDILGNEVAELVNEEKQPGNYEVVFDASQLSSGIYFYQLRAGSFVSTRKMILLK
ncbi:MAG: FG-GAP-like repeat-containing protein [Ignavibacteriaceae bacterium]